MLEAESTKSKKRAFLVTLIARFPLKRVVCINDFTTLHQNQPSISPRFSTCSTTTRTRGRAKPRIWPRNALALPSHILRSRLARSSTRNVSITIPAITICPVLKQAVARSFYHVLEDELNVICATRASAGESAAMVLAGGGDSSGATLRTQNFGFGAG